jgi:diacylglycerol kinase (ATP)
MKPSSMPPENNAGLARVWRAFFYSRDGLIAAYKNEAAFRQEVWLALVLIPLSFFLPVSTLGKALMIASVLLVLIVELLNSAIEAIVDLASPGQHKLAKHAKDMGSAAVLISLVNVGCVWLGVWVVR